MARTNSVHESRVPLHQANRRRAARKKEPPLPAWAVTLLDAALAARVIEDAPAGHDAQLAAATMLADAVLRPAAKAIKAEPEEANAA